MKQVLAIGTSPHLKGPLATETIMRHVVYALLPTIAFALYWFGLDALLILATTTGTCLGCEWLCCRTGGQAGSLSDWSALITGLLLGLTLPSTLPLWMAALGAAVAMLLGKCLFGGLGSNPFNPALVGRAFLMAAFPAALTTWHLPAGTERFSHISQSLTTFPFLQPNYDGLSGATPLGAWKFNGWDSPLFDMLWGGCGGSMGETSALLIALGGLYLAARKMLDWRIPAGIFATVALLSGLLRLWQPETYAAPPFHLFSGGLMLGAFFMATDMVTSPVTRLGVWLYAGLIGLVVVVIRSWGGLPEGVMYAILLGNACTPLIEKVTAPKPFGTPSREVAP